jgi:hypothetical protein
MKRLGRISIKRTLLILGAIGLFGAPPSLAMAKTGDVGVVQTQSQSNLAETPLRMAQANNVRVRNKSARTNSERIGRSRMTPRSAQRRPGHRHWYSGRCRVDDCPRW